MSIAQQRSVIVTTHSGARSSIVLASVLAKTQRTQRTSTRVGRYVDNRAPALTHKISKVLRKAKNELKDKIVEAYTNQFVKAERSENEIIQDMLDELDLTGVSIQMVDKITPEMVDAFEEAGSYGVSQAGFEAGTDIVKQLDQAAESYAKKRGGELIKDLAQTTEDALRTLLARGVSEGMSPQKLASELNVEGAFGQVRSMMIARTELAFAHVAGNMEGWKTTGQVNRKKWLTAEGCCDLCDALDGTIVDIDEDFPDDGGSGPPLHPNCRCDVLPVLTEQE